MIGLSGIYNSGHGRQVIRQDRAGQEGVSYDRDKRKDEYSALLRKGSGEGSHRANQTNVRLPHDGGVPNPYYAGCACGKRLHHRYHHDD